MPDTPSRMRREIAEIPQALDTLLSRGEGPVSEAAAAIRAVDPAYLISVARGSSDHAASFMKYVSELLLGLPMASVGPSVASVYGARLKVRGAACLCVSQSGRSPDIVRLAQTVTGTGAYSVAITNDPGSPLAAATSATLPIHAGAERSVAATKTFVTSLVTGLWLLAAIRGDDDLIAAIRALPGQVARAASCDWSAAAEAVTDGSLYSLGRGPGWAISNEAALKFKETCQVHAESFSAAEVLHGPVSIVDRRFPVIAFAAADAAERPVAEVADALAGMGAQVFATTAHVGRAQVLEHVRSGHPMTDPIPLIVSFYAMVEAIATRRGIDPDRPRHLRKVTETT